ncbi:NADPH:quinone reductase [Nocardioides cynanchi]|uniref:NADPH:quinone reductase n=1 Tax=Nocardioides cynanchi TaxID=2558918 RepID=UPI0012445DF7|nr:NADPH:quinone reductase [Nocardioides cynanchi]
MRAVAYRTTGDSSVLEPTDLPIPEPGPGEVRVRVVVAGVNPTDWKARAGLTGPRDLPFDAVVPGQDGAGVVDAVGDGVSGLAAGDRVWVYLAQHGRPIGTAAEYAVVPEALAVRLPDSASYDVGASLGVPAMTAHRCLTVHEDGPTRLAPGALSGRTVLVTGGAGAVGHAAIQLARWAGAEVITTISTEAKARLATAAGAHHVVSYTDGDPAAAIRGIAPEGVDLVVEVALIQNVDLLGAVLKTRGSVAAYANTGGTEATLPFRSFMGLNARIQFVLLYTVGDAALRAAAEDVATAVAEGVLEVGDDAGLPLVRFPLDRTADAHDAVEQGAVGKVLIDI